MEEVVFITGYGQVGLGQGRTHSLLEQRGVTGGKKSFSLELREIVRFLTILCILQRSLWSHM